ncbi:hypothetical protein DAPPUDRAFT_99723 [Daphnia pulex]|uniref:Uncharacterized protein n=1 Tax=Daphnia pulex TaxID=6669 RepID=E9G7W6_DAPPU|nr:hypothetical protein DAPPUDRAFT_99723 [Daphnia pulex]|eukprot:EFX84554.1 hypothetical protein DAPPUDRAFT_99723 [Daphnia pulex]
MSFTTLEKTIRTGHFPFCFRLFPRECRAFDKLQPPGETYLVETYMSQRSGSKNDERQPSVPAVRGRLARRVRAAVAVNIRGTAVAQGVVVRVAAVRVYGNRRSKFRNGRGGGVVGGAIAIPVVLGPLVQAPDATEVPPNNPPPPVDEEHVGVLAVEGANCEI